MEYMKTNTNDFVDEMVRIKNRHGVSFRELGEAVHVKEATVIAWAHKKAKIPIDRAVGIMDYLGYNLAFIKKEQKEGENNARKSE